MPFVKLPRLPANMPIIDGDKPSLAFSRDWNTAMETVENALNTISQLLVDVGIAQYTADNGLTLAQSAINPGGTIKNEKVLTPSIMNNAVTDRPYSQLASPVVLPDGIDTTIVNLSYTKDVAESSTQIISTMRIKSSNDIVGVFNLYRDGGPGSGTLIDTAEYNCQTNGGVYKALIPYSFLDEEATVGAHSYYLSFERDGGGSSVNAEPGTILQILELKR